MIDMKLLLTMITTVIYFIYFYSMIKPHDSNISIPSKSVYPSPVEYESVSSVHSKGRKSSSYPTKQSIKRYNEEQRIYNKDRFGPLRNDSIVILIQVHNRIAYLRHLIKSLSEVKGISNHLLVFSHDHYNRVMNALVRNIYFCKTMQIFYPYSLQLYQSTFPGDDRLDCPPTNENLTNIKQYCRSSYDIYGNMREAKYCQIKHHWWWNWHWIFDELNITRTFRGLVVYLEEDYYVLKDFVHMLKLMYRTSIASFPSVNIISVQSEFEETPANQVTVDDWTQGIAMNRTTWNAIRRCSIHFCKYDDYNWDWSLINVAKHCTPLTAMTSKLSRIYNIGDCGMHGKSTNCKPWLAVKNLKNLLSEKLRFKLFPYYLDVVRTAPPEVGHRFPFGGWGDTRDHKLCMEIVAKTKH